MTTETIFQKYVDYINDKSNKPVNTTNQDKLDFYKFYKQATLGDCNTSQPSMFNFIDNEKWKAWNSVSGMSKEEAMQKYILLCKTKMINL